MNDLVLHRHPNGKLVPHRPPARCRLSIPLLRQAIDDGGAGAIRLLVRVGELLAATYLVVGWDDTTGHLECELEQQDQEEP